LEQALALLQGDDRSVRAHRRRHEIQGELKVALWQRCQRERQTSNHIVSVEPGGVDLIQSQQGLARLDCVWASLLQKAFQSCDRRLLEQLRIRKWKGGSGSVGGSHGS
jgi:hypothetical protein